ncbi:MAG: hypothetical protein JW804_06450 [Sedimentisphaerales bacterium]|nr:hypothetical protein [Sedimentisphaerales bacterium]
MPLDKQQIALTASVLVFFLVSIIGTINDISPFVCCKRALIAMVVTYIVVVLVVKFINHLVINAMISRQVNKIMEKFRNFNGPAN